MNTMWKPAVVAVALTALMTLPLANVRAQEAPTTTQTQTVGPRGRERHPEIRRAMVALENAKKHLQAANHDFGGHRIAALEACDNATAQLKLALQYDKE